MDHRATRWKYPDGTAVPVWHAVNTLASHWRFGYQKHWRSRSKLTNANPDFQAAQLAGWEAARADRPSIDRRAMEYAQNLIDWLLLGGGQ